MNADELRAIPRQVVVYPEPDGSAFNAIVPSLPGCFSCGGTPEEALAMAADAMACWFEHNPDADDFGPDVGGVHVSAAVPQYLVDRDDEFRKTPAELAKVRADDLQVMREVEAEMAAGHATA